jgi:YD repeat-containing protein
MRRWLYNPEGTLIQEITLNASGGVEYRFDIVNNSSSWTEKRMYLPPDILQYRIIADRDANSRLVRAIYLNSKGDQLRVDVYHYDKSGMLTRVDMANMGESLYEYDHNRDLRRKTINMPGASAHGDIHEFTYDERRLLIRDDYLKRSTTTFQYTLRR